MTYINQFKGFLIIALFSILIFRQTRAALQQKDITGFVGETVELPCQKDSQRCGLLHSLKWYRGSSRIFVFSDKALFSKPEGDYKGRASLKYNPNETVSYLVLDKLQVADEAVYKCEITYIDVIESCLVVQFINLTTLIKPNYIHISHSGKLLNNGSTFGPLTEGDKLSLLCEVGEGKPIPTIYWYNGNNRLQGNYTTVEGTNNIGTGKSILQKDVTRMDLNANYICKASSTALIEPLIASVIIEVNVKPKSIFLKSVQQPVSQDSNITLTCDVIGARPAANISWFNDTTPIPSSKVDTKIYENQWDGTFNTSSTFEFTASRYENNRTIKCSATNDVMERMNSQLLIENLHMQVHYRPIVSLFPTGVITINETGDILLTCDYDANPSQLTAYQWYFNNKPITEDTDHYVIQNTSLFIKKGNRETGGIYKCELQNVIGTSEPSNVVQVNVLYPPSVAVKTEPFGPVIENSHSNVTLRCIVVSGNPEELISVKWYFKGELQAHCTNRSDDCDPTSLRLYNVTRQKHGNYSCIGTTAAGTGPLSPNTMLMVYYEPGPASVTYVMINEDKTEMKVDAVIKKSTVVLSCNVKNGGRPKAERYIWYRGDRDLGIYTKNYTITANLWSRNNYSCQAVNDGGSGQLGTISLVVHAPPTFIKTPPAFATASVFDKEAELFCHVECFPNCTISWLRDGKPINPEEDSRYIINNVYYPENGTTYDFESIGSTLVFNISAFNNGRLDIEADSTTYTCKSSDNAAGPGVKMDTPFRVEYPPMNVSIKNVKSMINVSEGKAPPRLICEATALPEPSYYWNTPENIALGNRSHGKSLEIGQPLKKQDSGNYTCNATNKYGSNNASVYINVTYKPTCTVTLVTDNEGKSRLKCTAVGNPSVIDFKWKIQSENDTQEGEGATIIDEASWILLEDNADSAKTYYCIANNTEGGVECKKEIPASASWWSFLKQDITIYLAIIVAIILMFTIICVVIIIVCRRKRAADKCAGNLSNNNKSDGNSSNSDALLQPDNDKTFYENLPFHGIQTPPNKIDTENNRPASELSQCDASSGYGSTRSRNNIMILTENENIDKKFSSLRNHKSSRRNMLQFRSLRTNKTTMTPIKENSPESKSIDETPKIYPKPIPAPRKILAHSKRKHTYQNVPIPITPNRNNKFKPISSGLTNSDNMEYFRLTNTRNGPLTIIPNSTKVTYRHHNDRYEPPPPPAPSSIPRHHNSPPRRPSYQLNNGLIYSDNSISRHKKRHSRPYHPSSHQQYPISPTDYAVIKFHDVGKEIDV